MKFIKLCKFYICKCLLLLNTEFGRQNMLKRFKSPYFLRFQVLLRLLFNIVKSQIYGATVQNETVASADLKCY
jgi:hypothetical protein